jgi:hypothetical protein
MMLDLGGMGIGCFITVVATTIQTFSPRHKIGVFIFGRVLIVLVKEWHSQLVNCFHNLLQPLSGVSKLESFT